MSKTVTEGLRETRCEKGERRGKKDGGKKGGGGRERGVGEGSTFGKHLPDFPECTGVAEVNNELSSLYRTVSRVFFFFFGV